VLLHNKETLNTPNKPVAETIAMAKKDLHPGDVIDCLGGYTVYGMVEKASVAYEQNLVPLGCTIDGVVKKRVDAGEPLHYDDIELDETKRIVKLRRFQDKLVNGK
jgi:predicted homoserine dehydrogenase-like protein